jgi:flavorubredoxin
MAKNPKLKIISSKGGKISISRHHPAFAENLETVKTGDTLNTGKYNLKFFEAQMLHWPDTMFTYMEEHQLLISADAFGQHFASSQLFADEIDRQGLWFEAEKYFANILTPYSKQIVRKIEEFLSLNWPVKIIAPAHGVVWRKEPEVIINKYLEWANGVTTNSAVVIFDTIWGATEKMAKAICRGLDQEGVSYKMFSAGASDLNDVMTEILTTKAVIVGSPTLNNGIMPSLTPFLEELRGLRFQNKIGAAYGTYGWSGECIKRIEEALGFAHIEVAQPGIKFQFNAQDADLEKCVEFGREMGKKVKEANAK